MTLQNRVTPTGQIVAAPWRGSLMGNRGCLHREDGTLGAARWRHRAWVTCLLSFRDRHRLPMPPPGSPTVYTALFFWDEATALAAGHRPCGECRRADFLRFRAAAEAADLPARPIPALDRVLHAARVSPDRAQRCHQAALEDLPEGVFVLSEHVPCLFVDGALWPWREEGGYGPPRPANTGVVTVLTPATTVAVLRAGYRPAMRLPGPRLS
ncbi:MAG: hypothetical protein AAFS07_12980 [Pseudomonadota bacterium]